ncbi:hypothetical protein Bca52824_075510 [Brassica carinata]|uniref:asparagine--tRNA ligase n=1 Tax=Brassica carinata TaxID=52824 RepID=A0A8X7TWL4_BRACI|nr:hypothetical protein Bca52824_075510 [Brassica carinata]
MAAKFLPATTLRLTPFSTLRFSSFFHISKPLFRPLRRPFFEGFPANARRRCFCTAVSESTGSGEGKKVDNSYENRFGSKVGEFRRKLKIAEVKGGADQGLGRVGQSLSIMGWVRTLRSQSSVTFIEINDGSCLSNLQCVMNPDAEGYHQVESGSVLTGASISVQGTIVASQGTKQKVELKVDKIIVVGKCDSSYPIQKKRVSREFLRTKAHLRPRTNTFGAVARVRNALAYATHKFFQESGFVWVASPIITASDCEGAGEQFCVTTLIPSSHETTDSSIDAFQNKGRVGRLVSDFMVVLYSLTSQDFFGKPALDSLWATQWRNLCHRLSDVYTFGPTFRAENSNTSRHLAEFWMIEPELAFADLNDDMACATAYLQYVVKYVLDNCKEDMEFFDTWIDKGIIHRLSEVVEKEFLQLGYTDAIELLLKANKKFEFPVHNRGGFRGRPVIIRDYPKEIKAFYMRENDDGKTVAAMDMLVPRIGELIGGSQREERLEVLEARLDELKLDKESYWWYLDLRYGSVPHAGFGLGFERLVQFATGIDNIRDVIPFPRSPGSADF